MTNCQDCIYWVDNGKYGSFCNTHYSCGNGIAFYNKKWLKDNRRNEENVRT